MLGGEEKLEVCDYAELFRRLLEAVSVGVKIVRYCCADRVRLCVFHRRDWHIGLWRGLDEECVGVHFEDVPELGGEGLW